MNVHEQASRLRKLIAFRWFAALLFAAFPLQLLAQEDASLWGSIRDASGAGIAGATVKIKNLETGIVNYASQRAGGVGTSNSVLGNMFAASRRRPQENLYLLNGVEFTSASEINGTPGGRKRAASRSRRRQGICRGQGYLRRSIWKAAGCSSEHRHGGWHKSTARQRL